MRYVLAIFFPWVSFFTIRQFGKGFLCFLLQMSIIGYIPAIIWAIASVNAFNQDKRTDRVVEAINRNSPAAKPPPSAPHIPDYEPPPRPREPPQPLPTVESYLRSTSQRPSQRESPADRTFDIRTARDSQSQGSYDEKKWRALVRFDDEISAAAKTIRAFGVQWEDELARSYLRLNDKTYLDALVVKITREARAQSA